MIDLLKISSKDIELIKIDVEGHEYFVLQGMKRILREGNPIITVEILENNPFKKEMVSLIEKYGYKMCRKLDGTNYVI